MKSDIMASAPLLLLLLLLLLVTGVQLLNSLDMEALSEGPHWQQPQLQQQSLQLLLLKAKLLHRLHASNEPEQHPGLSREGQLAAAVAAAAFLLLLLLLLLLPLLLLPLLLLLLYIYNI